MTVTRRTVAILASLVPLLSAACAMVPTQDIEFQAEADPKARFAGYEDYTWLAEAAMLHDPEGHWEPPTFDVDAEVKFLIDRELRGRGMTENTSAPDAYIAFAVGVDMMALELETHPESQIDVIREVPRGGLLVAFVDAETGFVVWAGVATGEIQEDPDEETVKARLDYAVTKLLKRMPK